MRNLYMKDIMVSLIKSVDLVNYLLKDHHRRVAIIAYHIGQEMKLTKKELRKVVIAASLHDVGALYVKERDELIKIDTIQTAEHAIRGALLLENLNFFEPISDVILHHHRKWKNGEGANFDFKKVPMASFIIHLADRIEILLDSKQLYIFQIDKITHEIKARQGTVFEPSCVDAFLTVSSREGFWLSIDEMSFERLLNEVLEQSDHLEASIDLLEQISKVFSSIVDYRSQFTATHSSGVAQVAYALAHKCNCSEETCKRLRLAGYLHDIGKLGIPTEIIEKPSGLSDQERKIMKSHAYFTKVILNNIEGMEDICYWASMHHEKHDGSGYPFHCKEEKFSKEVDILILSDIFTALSENRPYRKGHKIQEVASILEFEKRYLDPFVFNKLMEHMNELDEVRFLAQKKSMTAYEMSMQSVKQLLNHADIVANF